MSINMKIYNIILVFVVLLAGCTEQYIGTYDISYSNVNLTYQGTMVSVVIEGQSNNWLATCSEDWIKLRHKNQMLEITGDPNFSENSRQGEIMITYRGELIDSIQVHQSGFAVESLDIVSTGDTIHYDFPTDIVDTVLCDSDWISVLPSYDEITIEVLENKGLYPRADLVKVVIDSVVHELLQIDQRATLLTFEDLCMIEVPAGTYLQGAQSYDSAAEGYDPEATGIESPTRRVTLDSFKIGQYEVSQDLWERVMCYNNSAAKGENLPVTNVTYAEITDFTARLSEYFGKTFRLPTEAEWEYVAKECGEDGYSLYSGSNDINEVAWYYSNSFKMLNYIGTKKPNSLGVYDMTGNVMEMCRGFYETYTEEDQTNPISDTGSLRVTRGGGWNSQRANCRVTYRFCVGDDTSGDNIGFRLLVE